MPARQPSAGRPKERSPERSFEELYAGNADRLVTLIYLVTGDVEEARDCVQEGFARAWLRWNTLRHGAEDPVAWVYTVSYRIAVSRFRRAVTHRLALRRLGARACDDALPGPSADVLAVRDALARLPQGQRAVLVLHYFGGLTVEAVAGTLGLSVSAVKARLARGRAALLPLLSDPPTPATGMSLTPRSLP